MSEQFSLYLIPLLPILGATFCILFGKRAGKDIVTAVALGAVLGSAMIAGTAVWHLHTDVAPGGSLTDTFFSGPWIKAGDLNLAAGLALDHLSAVLLCIITGIGFLIHLYASSYMEHDPGYARFFAYLNLFMGAMLILVLGDSIPVTFVGWEGVGLCSYLLIGFWHDKEANAYAGRKAFVVNRVGDFGFLLAMFVIYDKCGTLKYSEIATHADALHAIFVWGLPAAWFAGLLILVGATGKSAQIPLYIWLPDAMAGPTPVSALIHAATMVTAGVYVIARLHYVFEAAPVILMAVAFVGAITAFFAATIGFAQRDLKKVLAYSTISQLGFMFIGVGSFLGGTSNYAGGVFHLMTHAFFKAGLFLGAGSVMHALANEGDIMRMGGLKKWLPHTRWTFLIYCLAISGIPPFAGFWSKDAILGGVHHAEWVVGPNESEFFHFMGAHAGSIIYYIGLAAAGCTAFYMFRLYFLVFEGEYRGTEEQASHIHESPPAMTGVLWALAIGTCLVGFLGMPNAFGEHLNKFNEWLAPVVGEQAEAESAGQFLLAASIAIAVSLVGIGSAFMLYKDGPGKARQLVSNFTGFYELVYNKYKIDELYNVLIVRPIRFISLALWKVVDAFIIDKVFVLLPAYIVRIVGDLVRYLQNGDTQNYLVGVTAGTALIVIIAAYNPARKAAQFAVDVTGHEVTVTATSDPATTHGIQYRVTWDNEAISSYTASAQFHHTFPSGGKKEIKVETIDPRWKMTSTSKQTIELN